MLNSSTVEEPRASQACEEQMFVLWGSKELLTFRLRMQHSNCTSNCYFLVLPLRSPWSQPSGGSVVHHLHQRVLCFNTVTWLPTRMPSSHLDTDMAFLSDTSIVYTPHPTALHWLLRVLFHCQRKVPLQLGATSALSPTLVFLKQTSSHPICSSPSSPFSNQVPGWSSCSSLSYCPATHLYRHFC